jgi:hypothetical protein
MTAHSRIARADPWAPAGAARIDAAHLFEGFQGVVVLGDLMNQLTVELPEGPEEPVAQSHSAFDDRIEHGLCVGRRVRDRPQDLTGRCLLLQRDPQFTVPCLQLSEQPHVLDGDDRLVRECLEQLGLPFGKRPSLDSPDGDDAYGSACSNQWDAQNCAEIERSR